MLTHGPSDHYRTHLIGRHPLVSDTVPFGVWFPVQRSPPQKPISTYSCFWHDVPVDVGHSQGERWQTYLSENFILGKIGSNFKPAAAGRECAMWNGCGGTLVEFLFVVGDEKILGDKSFHINIDLAHDDDVPAILSARCLPAPFAHPATPSTAMPIPLTSCKDYWAEYDQFIRHINFTCVRHLLGYITVQADGNDKLPGHSAKYGSYHPCLKPTLWGGSSLPPQTQTPTLHCTGTRGERWRGERETGKGDVGGD